jgi:uncharacterized protein YndB with AHSA1/START domain
MTTTQFVFPPDEPVIAITRTFDAPRELVWETFTRPEHMARWWGPRRDTTIVHELDARVGGKWRIGHRGAKGEAHEFFGEFLELKAPEQMVLTFAFQSFPPVTETFLFSDLGGRTKLEAVMRFNSVASRDGMAASGMEGGARESYERLDQLLADLVAQPV